MKEEWGIPEAITHLDAVYEKLETIRQDLGKFVSYEDEGRSPIEGDCILRQLTRVIQSIEDTTDSISHKVNHLLEKES